MTNEEAIKHGIEQLEIFGGEHREFIEVAIQALESNHLCLTCANNKEGVCETQDLISCKYYKQRGEGNG